MFKSVRVDIGTVKSKMDHFAYFSYEDINEFINLNSSCGCGIPVQDKANSRIKVRFRPEPVPPHLTIRNQNSYKKVMYVYATYKDITDSIHKEELELIVTVVD